MIKISQELKVQFEALLAQEEIPKGLHSEYLKWLRYYLDFCHKYVFENSKSIFTVNGRINQNHWPLAIGLCALTVRSFLSFG